MEDWEESEKKRVVAEAADKKKRKLEEEAERQALDKYLKNVHRKWLEKEGVVDTSQGQEKEDGAVDTSQKHKWWDTKSDDYEEFRTRMRKRMGFIY